MCLNLSDHQFNTDCHILRLLYTNLMVTGKLLYIPKIKKKTKHDTTESHQSQGERAKEERNRKHKTN